MNTLPATSYDEVFDLLYRNEGIQQEAEYVPFIAEEYKNDDLADEILAYMSAPAIVAEVAPAAEVHATEVKEPTFADAVRDYLLMPAVQEDRKEELDFASNLAKAASYAKAVAINKKLMPSFFKTADELAAEASAKEAATNLAEANTKASRTNYDQIVAENRRIMPSFFEKFVDKSVEDDQPSEVIEENDDHLVWAELGHIRGLDPADPDTDYLAWSELGHIKDHDKELKKEADDANILRLVDAHIGFKGLIREINENPEQFRARVARLDGDKAAEAIIDESTAQTEEIVLEETNVEDDEADFAAWKTVLAANDDRNQTERVFWAESKAVEARRTRTMKALAAAAVALVAIPAIGSFLDNISSRVGIRHNIPADVRNSYKANPAANPAEAAISPEFEFATTTSTIVVENNVATITKTAELPAISLAEIAAIAKAKADAEDLAAAEAAAVAAEAERNRIKSFDEIMAAICGSDEVTSDFGPRIHPISGVWSPHTGIDLGCEESSDIYTPMPGTVVYAGWYGGYGNAVIVDHGNGLRTLYGHLESISVGVGDEITGQSVGKVGSTGNSTGPHAHVETQENGTPVDPRTVLGG